MRTRLVKIGIISLIIFSMVLVITLLLKPIYTKTNDYLLKFRTTLLSKLEEKTNLIIEYKKASPSFLNGLKLSDITCIEKESELVLLRINSVKLTYNLIPLIFGDIDNGLGDLYVVGLSAEYDTIKNKELINKLTSVFSSSGKKSDSPLITGFNIPIGIKLVNSSLTYVSSDYKLKTKIKNIYIKNSSDSSFFIAEIKGNADFVPLSKNFEKIGNFHTNYSLFSSFSTNMDEFGCQLRIMNLTNDDFSIKPFQIIANYSQSNISIKMLQNDAPLQLRADYNIETNIVAAYLSLEEFDPFSLITLKNKKSSISKIEGMNFSGEFQFALNEEQKTYNYSGIGKILTGKKFVLANTVTDFSLNGNEKEISVPVFSINSDYLSAKFEGNCDLQTLQPQGTVLLDYFYLQNGNKLSFEMYIDHLQKGFMLFIPELNFGNQSFTAFEIDVIPEKNSIDYVVSVSDYSHQNENILGQIKADGSLLLENDPFLQCRLSMDSIYLSSLLKTAGFFMDTQTSQTITNLAVSTNSFIMTNECYFSSNFLNLSYNIPYSVIANTKNDKEMALFSFDGNENNVQISQFTVLYAGQEINLNLQADYSNGFNNLIANSDVEVNAIPYTFSCNIVNGQRISVLGNYGFDCEFLLSKKGFSGNILMDGLPVSIKNLFFAISMDTDFYFNSFSDWKANIARFDLIDNSGKQTIAPHLAFSGSLNTYGALFNKLTFADSASILSGKGNMLWTLDKELLSNVSLNVDVDNSSTSEKITIECLLSNPGNVTFAKLDLQNDIFISAQIGIQNSPLSRFLSNQKTPNVVNASVNLLGTISNPGMNIDIFESSMSLAGNSIDFAVSASLEDKIFSISNADLSYAGQKLTKITSRIDVTNFSGTINGMLIANLVGESIQSPFTAELVNQNVNKTNFFPTLDNLMVNLLFENIDSNKYGNFGKTKLLIMKTPTRIDLIGGDKNELVGSLINNEQINLSLSNKLPFNFNMKGSIKDSLLDLSVNNIYIDFEKCSKVINFWFFQAFEGIATGNLQIKGISTDPEFNGKIICQNLKFTSPGFLNEKLIGKTITFVAADNIISAKNFSCKSQKGYVDASLSIEFDQWSLYGIDLAIKTRENNLIDAKFSMPNMEFEGDAACDLGVNIIMTEGLTVNGSVFVDNAEGTFTLFSKQQEENSGAYFSTKVNIDVLIGQHGKVQFPNKENPILRALINPQTNISVRMDTDNNYFELNGDLVLRGGEVVTLGRTFYLREGRLLLKENQNSFDPTITVRAEMRETDSEGNNVRIILSANNQKISMFTPTFTAQPAKSEAEIMTLLGQIVVSEDTENLRDLGVNVLAGGLNYVAQTTAIKQVENGLRDFFKFDIFSLHTSIIENALIVGADESEKTVTIGNYLDDSSVYIGKYLGNALYLDALLHLNYNASLVDSGKSTTGLTLEPEFGFELDSPFAVIRWSIAPDIGSLNKFLVPDASIGLSWKIVF